MKKTLVGLFLLAASLVGQTINMGRQYTGVVNASGATQTAPFRIGAADPGTCDNTLREFFYNTVSNKLKVCNTLNVWTAAGGVLDSYLDYKAAICQNVTATAELISLMWTIRRTQ
jgi:hypothetical protein